MERRQFLRAIGGVGLFGIPASADHVRHRTQARTTCDLRCLGLPYDYRTGGGVGKVSAVSFRALPVQSTPTADRVKFYQWKTPALAFGHCSLSRMAVTLVADSNWIVSFRAEQNPLFPIETQQIIARGPDGKGGQALYTNHLKRNTFHVTLRGYGGYSDEDANPLTAPGKPVLVEFKLAPFVVERAVPNDYRTSGIKAEVARYFDQIDRFEIEYTYD